MDKFPEFEETTFYREWRKADIAGMFKDEAQRLDCLRLARGIYDRVKLRAAGIDPDLPNGGPSRRH